MPSVKPHGRVVFLCKAPQRGEHGFIEHGADHDVLDLFLARVGGGEAVHLPCSDAVSGLGVDVKCLG